MLNILIIIWWYLDDEVLFRTHPSINLTVIRPSLRSYLCPFVCRIFSNPNWVAKWSRIFTKPSPNIKFGLPNSFKFSRLVPVPMYKDSAWKCAPYLLFCYFFHKFFLKLWSLSLLKMKKKTPHLKKISRRNFFVLFIFSNSVRKSSKMA